MDKFLFITQIFNEDTSPDFFPLFIIRVRFDYQWHQNTLKYASHRKTILGQYCLYWLKYGYILTDIVKITKD